MTSLTVGQFEFIYNALSFSIAAMGSATLFFWMSRGQVAPQFRRALLIAGLVTFIATYHYWRIFNSWNEAFTINSSTGALVPTGTKFNEAYRYVDWFLTVPLLLVELILVMGLSRAETFSKGTRLGLLAALMVGLGYPGEIAGDINSRLVWGGLSMIPFLLILYPLLVGLRASVASQPPGARNLVSLAVWVTLGSWSFYPIVYFAPLLIGAENARLATMSGDAATIVQLGYTVADIIAKAGFGILIFLIASAKTEAWRSKEPAAADAAGMI